MIKNDNRLTQIESDGKHTRQAVDEIKGDLKQVMSQLTAVATTISTRRE